MKHLIVPALALLTMPALAANDPSLGAPPVLNSGSAQISPTSQEAPPATIRTQDIPAPIADLNTAYNRFAVVDFTRGEASLDSIGRQRIAQAIRDAGLRGTIDEVRVLSWGDTPANTVGEADRNKDINLARDRGRQVETYLATLGRSFIVRSHNLAQRPTALSELLSSGDGRIVTPITSAGYGATSATPSKALVLVIMRK